MIERVTVPGSLSRRRGESGVGLLQYGSISTIMLQFEWGTDMLTAVDEIATTSHRLLSSTPVRIEAIGSGSTQYAALDVDCGSSENLSEWAFK